MRIALGRRFAALVLVVLATSPARASIILPLDLGASDVALCGNAVAKPDDGPRMLFHNPAGVSLLSGTEAGYGVLAIPINGRYENDATGYDEKSAEFAASPTLWMASDAFAPWHVGFGVYGSVGTSFNFAEDASAGFPNRFLGESTVLSFGLNVGREIAPGLRFGIQLTPSYGKIRARYPSPLGAVSFDIQGFGIGGLAGLLYEPIDGTTFGLAYKSPARVFLSGDADVGEIDDEVDMTFHVPQWIVFGFAQELMPNLVLIGQARWTDYDDFEKSEFEFDDTEALDQPFIREAKSRFRYGFGVEWEFTEGSVLRGGFSHEDWMMSESSMSPLLYDGADFLVGVGFGTRFLERWKVDVALGKAYVDDRVVEAEENPLFPGRFQTESPVVAGFMIAYQFGEGSTQP